MAYDSALTIISDAASELGLGTVADAYGSSDANIVQLRGLLKSGGRDIVRGRNWTHLIKEYSLVTRTKWTAATLYVAPTAWSANSSVAVGKLVTNAGNVYRCTTSGITVAGVGVASGPTTVSTSIADGTAVWSYVNAGTAVQYVSGLYYYTPATYGTSGSGPPTGSSSASTGEQGYGDTGITWAWGGNASDYALPSDFGELIDQTGWNRTSQLPVGGPVDGQMWQYLKGRAQGVVFNVLFRPVAGLLRLYPDTDPTGGYLIAFEYVSSSWVSAAGGAVPTTDAPTANSDIIYFDSLLMVRKLKLEWLKAKGFDTTHARRDYDDQMESVVNADSPAPVLSLAGRNSGRPPLLGWNNIPDTGYGS